MRERENLEVIHFVRERENLERQIDLFKEREKMGKIKWETKRGREKIWERNKIWEN